jgi:PAS domain S-box-containing protein
MPENKYENPNEDDYKKFFDETPVALIRTDLKTGKFLMANRYAAQMLGYESVQDLKDNGCSVNFYPPEDRKKLISSLRRNGVVEGYEIQLQVPNKTLWVSARMRINCDGTCIEGSLIDITEKVELRTKQLKCLQEVGSKIDKKLAALAG